MLVSLELHLCVVAVRESVYMSLCMSAVLLNRSFPDLNRDHTLSKQQAPAF